MKSGIFITGTDTNIGKTVTSSLLINALRSQGRKAKYFKPFQTGGDSDAAVVADLSSTLLEEFPKPAYSFPEPLAPACAARLHQAQVSLDSVVEQWNRLDDTCTWVVEGAGGLLVPINEKEAMRDLALALDLKVVLVASSRLGTINHTLLSLEAAKNSGLEVLGIILVGPPIPEIEPFLAGPCGTPILARIPLFDKLTPAEIQKNASLLFPERVLKKIFGDSLGLSERDRKAIWHPFSQHGLKQEILPVKSASGSYLYLEDGRRILDGISSWWVNIHGHAHPAIAQAIYKQASQLEHVIFSGFTHGPGVSFAEELLNYPSIKDAGLEKVFYSDNGSTAIEAALKMTYQYHINRGDTDRHRFLALNDSYHGDTIGAMAVTQPGGFNQIFQKLLAQVDFVQPGNLDQLERILDESANRYSAFIFEPMVQGVSGMKIHEASYLEKAVKLCQSKGILAIADEVFTGFFRTGKCFAFEYAAIRPDVVCLSKGITGGFLALGATLASEKVFSAFLSKNIRDAFLHGHSYCGNPIACAAALASWRLLTSDECQVQIQKIAKRTQQRVRELESHPRVKDARCIGTIGAIELKDNWTYFSNSAGTPSHSKSFMTLAIEKGVLLRPLGNVLYSVPPYSTTEEEIDRIYQVIYELIEEKNNDASSS